MSNRLSLKNKFSTGKKPTGADFASLVNEASDAKEMAEQILDKSFDTGVLDTEIERRLNDKEAEYAPKLTSLESQLAEKAKQEDLEIERARISNLTANAGNTDGNAELLDIRVGFDGITYATAGEATRALSSYMKTSGEPWGVV